MIYEVAVVIENKPIARDPEGETILRDLILRGGYSAIKNVRAGKQLRMQVEAKNEKEAKEVVMKMCNDLRLYNPVAHICFIEVRGAK